MGAGKTTLVNYVLNADHGYRVAVILNDFGASLGVEKMLVQDKPDGDNAVEEWVELNNGCVCCTVKGSLVQTIDNLLEKRAATGRKFDFILLETTGLADPGPGAQELWVDDEILEEDGAVLDAVVTLVDASNIERQLAENKEASLQIAYADTVVLNKCDIVSERDLERVEALVAGINAEAKVVRSTRSVVELGVILNQGAVSSAGRRTGVRPTLTSELATEAPAPGFWAKGVEKYAKTQPLGEVHDRSIRTICLVAEGRVDVRKVEAWLEELLWEQGGPSGAHVSKTSLNSSAHSSLTNSNLAIAWSLVMVPASKAALMAPILVAHSSLTSAISSRHFLTHGGLGPNGGRGPGWGP